MNEKSCLADDEAHIKDDYDGAEAGTDATILEQKIAYEARSDESKREFLATMRRLLCDGAARIQSIRVSTLAAIDEGLRLANRTNAAYALARREHSVETNRPTVIVDRRVCVEAALAAAWAQIGEALTATIQEALEKGSDEYNSALEMHATRTHVRVHALKEAHAKRLATHRRATAAAAATREAKLGLRLEAIKAESRQKLRHELAKSERQHVEEMEYVMAKEQIVDRKLVLTQAELDRERRAVSNLRQELTKLLDKRLDGDDAVSEELARIDKLLALTGYDRRQALKMRLLVPIESSEPKKVDKYIYPELGLQNSLPKTSCQKASKSSVDAAISLHPDKYWLLKSEIVRLRSKTSSLQKDVEIARSNSREALVASVESKREKVELEKQLNDARKKYNVLKSAQQQSAQQLTESSAKQSSGLVSQLSSRESASNKKAHHRGNKKRVKKQICSVIKRNTTEILHGSHAELGDDLLSGVEDLAAEASSCAVSAFNNVSAFSRGLSVTFPTEDDKSQGEDTSRQQHVNKARQRNEREMNLVPLSSDENSLGVADSFMPSLTTGISGIESCLAVKTHPSPVAESAPKIAENEFHPDVNARLETSTTCVVMQPQPWDPNAVLLVRAQPFAAATPRNRHSESYVHPRTVDFPVSAPDTTNAQSCYPGVKPALEKLPHCCAPAPCSHEFNIQSIVAVPYTSASNGSIPPALPKSTERPSELDHCDLAKPNTTREPRGHDMQQSLEPANADYIGALSACAAEDSDSKLVLGFVNNDDGRNALPATKHLALQGDEEEVRKCSQFDRTRRAQESQLASTSLVVHNSKSIAHLTMDLERESRAVAHARAEAARLHSNTTSLKQRVAKLELVIAEKNAIVREMTRLARSYREKALDAEARLKQLNSNDETRYVLDPNIALPSNHKVSSHRSSPTYYQHGPVQMSTPLRQPVTGDVIYVKAPIRQAPQHQARPIGDLQSEVRKAVATVVSSALDPSVVSASVPRVYLPHAAISANTVRHSSRIMNHDN